MESYGCVYWGFTVDEIVSIAGTDPKLRFNSTTQWLSIRWCRRAGSKGSYYREFIISSDLVITKVIVITDLGPGKSIILANIILSRDHYIESPNVTNSTNRIYITCQLYAFVSKFGVMFVSNSGQSYKKQPSLNAYNFSHRQYF